MISFLDPRLPDSFWSKVMPEPNSGCWLWLASVTRDGYGQSYFYGGDAGTKAHRVTYRELVGPIPSGLQLDHLCRVRSCCNPDHLEVVTPRENAMRGVSFSAVNARKTHCINGHELTGNNVYARREGGRKCYRCAMDASARSKRAARAARRDAIGGAA